MSNVRCRKWQITINNPIEKGYDHNRLKEELGKMKLSYWCMSDEIGLEGGTYHTHIFLCNANGIYFTTIQKRFPNMHYVLCNGTPKENRDYIFKEGKWLGNKKEDTNLKDTHEEWGEMPEENQGKRTDLDTINQLLDEGKSPDDIFDELGIQARRYEKLIRDAYYSLRDKNTPFRRKLYVEWHCGVSGSGKSYVADKLVEQGREKDLYMYVDYSNGGLDKYYGQSILFMDEFRGSAMPFRNLLLLLNEQKIQHHARNTNVIGLWNEVYITSVMPPDMCYSKMVNEEKDIDSFEQLKRRIDFIFYHWKEETKEGTKYYEFKIPMKEYINYKDLQNRAYLSIKKDKNFNEIEEPKDNPFKE